ncbi:hypothetical protein BDW74DRAFT_164347 [Aspergillus multicolor]|uniref:uncharacterized protein n=1 Tax=Aspergillus multicolor TaxID=41759 RepID=UPI003CCD446C
MIVNRFTPLNSHPVSPIAERAYTLSPSWIVNDFPAPEPTAPLPRPECLTITPPPSDIKPPSIPPKIPLDTEPEPTFSRNADYLPLFPSPPQDALPTWGKPGTPGPVQIYLPPTPPDYIAFPWPDHPPPIPPRPQASAQGMLHTRIPSPCLHLTPPMPDYPPPPPQEQFQRLSQTAHASETSALPVSSASLPTPASSILELPSPPTTEARQTPTRPSPGALARKSLDFLRAAPTSAFQPSTTILSAANNNSDASNSSSSSKTSTSTSTIPTPQSPPTSIPSLKDTSNIPLETLTSHAQAQVTQARTLFDLVSQRLTPGENIWINDTISDTETAVREILVLTEGLRVDRQTKNGKLGLKTQFKWMMRDSRKAKEKRERLVLCNASLGGVLVRLQGVYSTLHVNNETAQLEEKAELGPSEPANVNGSTQRPTSTLHVAEPESPPWDLKMELQDAGMEVVVDEPVPGKEERSPSRFETQSPTPTISTGVSMQGSLGSAPSIVTLDHELLDMLSWRWAQGQSMR